MWKPPAAILGCCLSALPLIGCAGNVTALRQDGVPVPTAAVAAVPAEDVYATGPAMPAAILVFVPGMNAVSRGDFLPRDPALWAAQGFDVVMPQPSWSTRLIADQEAALDRLLASARSLADAPIWLIGPGPVIEAAMPQLGPSQVSGVVVTSLTSNGSLIGCVSGPPCSPQLNSLHAGFNSVFGRLNSLFDGFNSLFGRLGNLPSAQLKKQ